MKKRLFSIMGLSFLLAVFALAAVPAQAQNVDQKIQALEQELSQLKSDQMELRKDATAAAAALPSFSYRPGRGMLIEAANKAWSLRLSIEGHMRMLFLSGRDQMGRTNGEILGRRFRPEFYYCLNNCLYEIEAKLDMDGFGTGNAKNSTGTGVGPMLQRGAFHFHAEKLNPYMPTVTVGMDVSTAAAATISRQGSSATGSQREYDLLSRNVGPNTGASGNGITFTWDNRSLKSIGIPGRIGRFQVSMANISEGADGLSNFTDRKDFNIYGGIYPASDLKNKWLRGLYFEVGTWFCNVDKRAVNGTGNTDNGCSRVRLRDHGDAARQTIFDTGSDSIGGGLVFWVQPGLSWTVGPYRLRVVRGFFGADDDGSSFQTPNSSPGKKRGRNFLIGHDLFVWSPKGFLTGSANTPGSVLIGTHFERNDVSCGDRIRTCGNINGGAFHRETMLLREWDIYYFVAPRMSVGFSLLWYDASNLRHTRNQAAHNLGVCSSSKIATGGCRRGIGGDWVDMSLDWRFSF